MTVPCMGQDELISHIKAHGWSIASTAYWEEYNRIIFKKDDKTITFQCRDKYFYIAVYRTCKIFDIPVPEEHAHEYYLHMGMHDEQCYCGKSLAFKECHGKPDE